MPCAASRGLSACLAAVIQLRCALCCRGISSGIACMEEACLILLVFAEKREKPAQYVSIWNGGASCVLYVPVANITAAA